MPPRTIGYLGDGVRGWKARQNNAKARAAAKADPAQADIRAQRDAIIQRDRLAAEVMAAEERVARCDDEAARLRDVLAGLEVFSAAHGRVHSQLPPTRIMLDSAEKLARSARVDLQATRQRAGLVDDTAEPVAEPPRRGPGRPPKVHH